MTDNDKAQFSKAIAAICLACREPKPDATQLRTYFQALNDLDVELVELAAMHLVKTAKFMPKPAEWRDAVALIERERQQAQADTIRQLHAVGRLLCAACDDTGWVRNDETNRVASCDCRRVRRLEILGRRPMPALPEAVGQR